MNPEVVLRPIEANDLPLIARVHMDSFPESALTKLGAATVELYYHWQLTGPHPKVRATLAVFKNECAGFSFSGLFHGSTSGFVKRYKRHLILAAFSRPQLVFNALFLKRVSDGVRLIARVARKQTALSSTDTVQRVPDYGILSLAVATRFQKLGIGHLLMLDAEEEALRYGRSEICLTVHPENKKAVQFYENQNWQRRMTADLWTGTMVKTLNKETASPIVFR